MKNSEDCLSLRPLTQTSASLITTWRQSPRGEGITRLEIGFKWAIIRQEVLWM